MEGKTVQDFFHGFGSINWVVSLVFAIVLSIIANFLTYALRNWAARRSAKRADRRSRQLEDELRLLEKLAQSPFDLALALAAQGVVVLVFFVMGSAIVTLSNIPEQFMSDQMSGTLTAFGTLFYLLSILVGFSTLRRIAHLRDFSAYRERTEREIADLKARASK